MNYSSNSASTTYLRKTVGNDFQKEFLYKHKKYIEPPALIEDVEEKLGSAK
jgi:hypothetical protein